MFHFVFFILLSLTSSHLADALVCATNCSYTGNINNITLPSCNFINKTTSEHSCLVVITMDYVSGWINVRSNSRTPPAIPTFDSATVFSLSNEGIGLTLEYDCASSDKCDMSFVSDVLNSDWVKVQDRVKSLRSTLGGILFNSSDLRPTDTCPSNQPCSGQGFCQMTYQIWSDTARPVFQSNCANSTEQPLLQWVQAYDQTKIGEVLIYTCNQPSCASQAIAESIIQVLQRDYILPFNVTIPSATTTTLVSTISPMSTTTSMSTMSTATSMPTKSSTPKSMADSSFIDQTGKIIFTFASFLFLYLSST